MSLGSSRGRLSEAVQLLSAARAKPNAKGGGAAIEEEQQEQNKIRTQGGKGIVRSPISVYKGPRLTQGNIEQCAWSAAALERYTDTTACLCTRICMHV